MSTFIEQAVTVEEIAEVSRTTVAKVAAEAEALALFIGVDWAGRPALSEWDGYQLVSGLARVQQEADRAWHLHTEATSGWERDRRSAYLQAHGAAFAAAGGSRGGRPADRAAERAGDAAVGQWERRHPAPKWAGAATASVWRRAVDKVAEVLL